MRQTHFSTRNYIVFSPYLRYTQTGRRCPAEQLHYSYKQRYNNGHKKQTGGIRISRCALSADCKSILNMSWGRACWVLCWHVHLWLLEMAIIERRDGSWGATIMTFVIGFRTDFNITPDLWFSYSLASMSVLMNEQVSLLGIENQYLSLKNAELF